MIKLLLIIVIFILTNVYSFHIGRINILRKVCDCMIEVGRKVEEMDETISVSFLEGIDFVTDHLIEMIKRGI